MSALPFDTVKVVDLTDLYLTREEYNASMRRFVKKVRQNQVICFALGTMTSLLLLWAANDQNRRIGEMKKRSKNKNETAG